MGSTPKRDVIFDWNSWSASSSSPVSSPSARDSFPPHKLSAEPSTVPRTVSARGGW